MIADGEPTVGVTTTVLITWIDGELQPLATTWIFTDPEKLFAQVMTPDVGFIVPADALLKDHV